VVENREREWKRYRRKNKLDLLGRLSEGRALDSCHNIIDDTG
jgi:hypothetical protein